MTQNIYTEVEASKYLGISRKTISQHRKAGKINPQPFGKGWCYSQHALDTWRETYGEAVARRQALANSHKVNH